MHLLTLGQKTKRRIFGEQNEILSKQSHSLFACLWTAKCKQSNVGRWQNLCSTIEIQVTVLFHLVRSNPQQNSTNQ